MNDSFLGWVEGASEKAIMWPGAAHPFPLQYTSDVISGAGASEAILWPGKEKGQKNYTNTGSDVLRCRTIMLATTYW